MTRNEYRDILTSNGFVFEKTQKGYPGRGEEDVYTHPSYRYKFYVTRVRKSDESTYGFYTGKKNGEYLDGKVSRNAADDFRKDRSMQLWVDIAFVRLIHTSF